jgi:hypothetical protein
MNYVSRSARLTASYKFANEASGLHVGANARRIYRERKLFRGAKYPPIALAFYPGFAEATFFIVMFYLVFTTGLIVRAINRKPLRQQIMDMTKLWFRDGVDPPSYYALKLFDPKRACDSSHYMTRYETKNGLFHALNSVLPPPYAESEINNKALFAACCQKAKLPHARTLLSISGGKTKWHCEPDDLKTDLFCKRMRGVGAQGVVGYRYSEDGLYIDDAGNQFTHENLLRTLERKSTLHPFLVQPRLQNHPEISDFAEHSLIAIRVVTVINEFGSVEVALAMLRILPELEPRWNSLPDEEIAAPIDIETGEMGLLTGDKLFTVHLRYPNHPVTHAQVAGQKIKAWPDICELAVKAHTIFPHRLLIGWDIALTPCGPVLLEGNTNFDVMLLQRVHDGPIGRTRLGELINFHMATRLDSTKPFCESSDPNSRCASRRSNQIGEQLR